MTLEVGSSDFAAGILLARASILLYRFLEVEDRRDLIQFLSTEIQALSSHYIENSQHVTPRCVRDKAPRALVDDQMRALGIVKRVDPPMRLVALLLRQIVQRV